MSIYSRKLTGIGLQVALFLHGWSIQLFGSHLKSFCVRSNRQLKLDINILRCIQRKLSSGKTHISFLEHPFSLQLDFSSHFSPPKPALQSQKGFCSLNLHSPPFWHDNEQFNCSSHNVPTKPSGQMHSKIGGSPFALFSTMHSPPLKHTFETHDRRLSKHPQLEEIL